MKNIFIIILGFVLLTSCRKELIKESTAVNETKTNQVANNLHRDTIKSAPYLAGGKRTNNYITFHTGVNYVGNDQYKFTIEAEGAYNIDLHFYRNGYMYQSVGWVRLPYTATHSLPPGNYSYLLQFGLGGTQYFVAQATIINKPVAPAGMICLFEYFNSFTGQHICTTDWEELASISHNFQIEKVLGYLYADPNAAPNLKPIYRYYNPNTGAHYTTGILKTYPGLVYEKILGYVGASAGGNLTRPLTKYYKSLTDDHFVCVPPEIPQDPDYIADDEFIFGYVQ